MLVSITTDGWGDAIVRFPYDPILVDTIRSVWGRHWNAAEKHWTIPATEINGAAVMFVEEGCTVTVDGELWRPPATLQPVPSNRVELLQRLFESIPDYLVQSTHRALIRAWHPDQGGDNALAQDLNAVWARSPKGL